MISDFARDHDVLGAGILFALAAACYVYHWTRLRREANLEPLADPIAVAIAFHTSPSAEDRIAIQAAEIVTGCDLLLTWSAALDSEDGEA